MRAQSLRRTLWMTNVGLGLAVAGVVAWYLVDVRPATADAKYLKPEFATKAYEKYRKQPNPGRIESAPVSQKDLEEVIDRKDYAKLNYWIFAGGMPPQPKEEVVAEEGPPPPQGLETLGRTYLIIYMAALPGQETAVDSVVMWEFSSKKRLAFKPGEFVKEKRDDKDRFKLVDVIPVAAGVSKYRIVYDVFDDPKGKPVRRSELLHDATPKNESKVIRDKVAGTAVVPPGGAAGETATAAPAAVVPGAPGEAAPPEEARVVPAFADIRPEINRVGRDRVDIAFDQKTYDYVRSKDLNSLVETVKTQPVTDRATGRPLGLKITGFSGDSPADRFDVRPGDILVSINGEAVRDRSDAVAIIQRMDPNIRRVTVVIDRNGNKLTYNIDPQDPRTRRAARNLDENR